MDWYYSPNNLSELHKDFFLNFTSHRWQIAAVLRATAALLSKGLNTLLGKYKQSVEE